MVFSSIFFLMYFLPVFFLVYFTLPDKFKNIWIVIASLLFHSWGAPVFIFTLVASCFVDFIAAKQISKKSGKLAISLAVLFNVLMLVYFKYAGFFVENFNYVSEILFGSKIPFADVILPIGISFLTFQKISYLIDVRRGDCSPQYNFINYLLYVLLFPHLIAGPIVRYKEINEQITGRFPEINSNNIFSGLIQFIIGLSKKVFVANILGNHADEVFTAGSVDMTIAWTGIIAYTFQIYFDFSGYSDMAIGLGKMMGFKIPLNFNFPYSSRSITEFWRRWHITLGNWMKDYLYVPLGGNRGNHTYRNLMIVFLISGLWHGASWNFVLWGAFHGTFLVVERLGLRNVLQKCGAVLPTGYTFLVVMIGWVLFRVENFHDALLFYKHLFSVSGINYDYLSTINPRIYFVFITACIFSFVPDRMQQLFLTFYDPLRKSISLGVFAGTTVLLLYILNLGELMATGFNPFIYFRF